MIATKRHSSPASPGAVGDGSTMSGAHTATATALPNSNSSMLLLSTAAAVEVYRGQDGSKGSDVQAFDG